MTYLDLELIFQLTVHLSAMDLLKAMLEIDPNKRISSKNALDHPAFHILLSKSPLIERNVKNTSSLLKHDELTKELINK